LHRRLSAWAWRFNPSAFYHDGAHGSARLFDRLECEHAFSIGYADYAFPAALDDGAADRALSFCNGNAVGYLDLILRHTRKDLAMVSFALAQWRMSLDVEALAAALARFTPLFREAWSYYGEEAEAFDFAVISALDMVASTPEVDLASARLVRKEAVWLYEDPAIEGLPAIQKQVLRMGPDNAAIVKDKASQARTIWVATLGEAP